MNRHPVNGRNREETMADQRDILLQQLRSWLSDDSPDTLAITSGKLPIIYDVLVYLEAQGRDPDGFVIHNRIGLVSAGVHPKDVPTTVIEVLGQRLAGRRYSDDIELSVYAYDDWYFVLDGYGQQPFETEAEAMDEAGISATDDDPDVAAAPPPSPVSDGRRPVLIIVPEWPGGTMAMKFGSALKVALQLEGEDWSLVQMAPERIFRAVTRVTEEELRSELAKESESIQFTYAALDKR
jgi:hypothetical protein